MLMNCSRVASVIGINITTEVKINYKMTPDPMFHGLFRLNAHEIFFSFICLYNKVLPYGIKWLLNLFIATKWIVSFQPFEKVTHFTNFYIENWYEHDCIHRLNKVDLLITWELICRTLSIKNECAQIQNEKNIFVLDYSLYKN